MNKTDNPLNEGAFGSRMVAFFEKEHQRVAIDAESISFDLEENTGNYRVTFDDESVEDWKVYFPSAHTLEITWAEMYDKII